MLLIGLSLLGISVHSWLTVLLAAAAAVYLLNQLPYTIGQTSMHRAVVRGYSETKRAELLKKLGETFKRKEREARLSACDFVGEPEKMQQN